jgi:DNA repair exonuclease SbcCD nuclease subunit
MNYLIFGDIHISQSSLKECELIFQEIVGLCNKYSITHLISLGDNFDNNKPTASELNCFGKFIRQLGNRKIILLAAQSHESETLELSSVDIYGILSNNVTVTKEYKDQNHLYCGHFVLTDSNKNYGAKLSKEDLKNYAYVFLGHQHSYQIIKPNTCHLGSCRYINFDEAENKYKVIAIISNYNTEQEEVHFMKLKSPISMIQLELNQNNQENPILDPQNGVPDLKSSISEGGSATNSRQNYTTVELIAKLDKTDSNTKVKVKILDFESFRQFLPLCNKYSTKFVTFKYETLFEVVSANNQKDTQAEMTSFKESFTNWIKNQKIDPKIAEILQKEVE